VPKRILLIAVRSTPQLIADALRLWSGVELLAVDEIHVLANASMCRRIVRELLDGGQRSPFRRLCRELGLSRDDLVFNARTIHDLDAQSVPAPAQATPIDAIVRLVHDVRRTDAPVVAITAADAALDAVAIALALQVAGEPGDRLFVIEPSRERGRLREVPILLHASQRIAGIGCYEALVDAARRAARLCREPAALTIDLGRQTLAIDGVAISLTSRQFFWYAAIASFAPAPLSLSGLGEALARVPRGAVPPEAAALTRLHARVCAYEHDEWPRILRIACGPVPGLPSTVCKINAALRRALCDGAEPYLVRGGRGAGGYAIRLERSKVVIRDTRPR
jgi:hypothetical protein